MGGEGGSRCFHIASKPFVMAGVDSGLVIIIIIIIVVIVVIIVITIIIITRPRPAFGRLGLGGSSGR